MDFDTINTKLDTIIGTMNDNIFGSTIEFLDSKYTTNSGMQLNFSYTVTENCYILVIIGAFGYNNLSLTKNGREVQPIEKIDNQYNEQNHLYVYNLECVANDVLLANATPGSYNGRASHCMIFKS